MDSSPARSSTFETSVQADPDQAGRPTAERLFDIAAALFCEKGYAATTTREIAAVAGIQQASLYYHEAGKEDLLHQIRHVTMLKELRALSDPHCTAVIALRKKYANLVRSVIEGAQAAAAIRVDIRPDGSTFA